MTTTFTSGYRSAVLLAGFIAALFLTASVVPVSAQEWRVVQTPDGATYLILGGVRQAITIEMISDEELATIPESVSAPIPADESGPVSEEPSEAPSADSSPRLGLTRSVTPTRNGQVVAILQITAVTLRDRVTGFYRLDVPKGRYAAVDWAVTNAGSTDYRLSTSDLKLQTGSNQILTPKRLVGMPGPDLDSGTLGPGQSVRGSLYYDVPSGENIAALIFQDARSPQVVLARP